MSTHKDFIAASKPLTVESASNLGSIPKPPMLIEDILAEGSLTLVSGQAYSSKTGIALEMARAVATGTPFLGKWEVPHAGNVLLIEQDSPRYDTGRQLWAMLKRQYFEETREEREEHGGYSIVSPISIAWHQGMNLQDISHIYRIVKTANSLYTYRGEGVYAVPNVKYADDGSVESVTMERVEMDWGYMGASLIILDSARSLHQAEENDSGQMEQVIQNIKLLRRLTGSTVVLIAHDGAAGERTRGSTAVDGGVDSHYLITSRKNHGDYGFHVRKARAIRPPEFRYKIEEGSDPEIGPIKTFVYTEDIIPGEEKPADPGPQKDNPLKTALYRYIVDQGRPTLASLIEWGDKKGVAKRTVQGWLSDGRKDNYLESVIETRDGKKAAVYYVRGTPA